MIKLIPLGGAEDIGASCFYLDFFGSGLILDCGIHPQKTGIDALPNFDLLNDLPLDAVLISHAHQDHIGSLPFLVKRHPYLRIFTTPQTNEIADLTLHNSVKIIREQIDADVIQPYDHQEIDLLIKSIDTKKYNETFEFKGLRHQLNESIKITFWDAGHILGSAGIYFECGDYKLFYSGDINLSPQTIMKGAKIPRKNITTLILECTYGNTDSKNINEWDDEFHRMTRQLNKVINKGGSVLIPVFSLGKFQEILLKLSEMMKSGKLTETNIYTGGLGRAISRIYDHNKYLVDRNYKNEDIMNYPQINFNDITDYNYYIKKPGIVLASSGMILPKTSSFEFTKFWLHQKDFAIFIVGYMDPQTPGSTIAYSRKGGEIKLGSDDRSYKVKCDIKKFHFPSHSKREELINVVSRLNPSKVILVHGDYDAKNYIGYNILKRFPHVNLFSAQVSKPISI